MSAKYDEFPSLPFQDIKENPKRHGRTDGHTDGKTDGQRENSIPPPTHTHTNIVCGGIISDNGNIIYEGNNMIKMVTANRMLNLFFLVTAKLYVDYTCARVSLFLLAL